MSYCRCCGREMGSYALGLYHPTEHCECEYCERDPNFCTVCGWYIGNDEGKYTHRCQTNGVAE